MGMAMLSKSLFQFSVDGWGCVPSLLFNLRPNLVEVLRIMVTSFKRSHASTVALSAPNPEAGHNQPMPLTETSGHSWASPGQSLVGSLLIFPWVLAHTRFFCFQGKPFTVIQVYAPTSNVEEAEVEQFCEDLQTF